MAASSTVGQVGLGGPDGGGGRVQDQLGGARGSRAQAQALVKVQVEDT